MDLGFAAQGLRTIAATAMISYSIAYAADAPLSPAQLHAIKTATVYIISTIPTGTYSGSGFFIRTGGGHGYVITNNHVVHPEGQDATEAVVLDSGGSNERTVPGKVLATDPERDLALLEIEAEHLPDALAIADHAPPVETEGIFLVGFPFGDALSISNQHPAVNIASGTVSSLRYDEFGLLSQILIDGALNPGNSGGPVVSRKGEVVGISVATLAGAHIGILIPAQQAADMIAGWPVTLLRDQGPSRKDEANFTCTVTFSDPFSKVGACALLVVPTALIKAVPPATPMGSEFPCISPMAKAFPLVLNGNQAKGTVVLAAAASGGEQGVLVQVRWSIGGRTRYSNVKRWAVDFAATTPAAPLAPHAQLPPVGPADAPPAPAAAGPLPGSPPPDPGAAMAAAPLPALDITTRLPHPALDVLRAGAGRYLVLRADNGDVVIYDADHAKVTTTLTGIAAKGCLVAAGGSSVVTCNPELRQLSSYDLATGRSQVQNITLPLGGRVMSMTMGCGEDARVFLVVASDVHARQEPRAIRYIVDLASKGLTAMELPADHPRILDRDMRVVHQCVDSAGGALGEWYETGMAAVFGMQSSEGRLWKWCEVKEAPGELSASDDGRIYSSAGTIIDAQGAVTSTLSGRRLSCDIGGLLFIGVDPAGGASIYVTGQTAPLAKLGDFPELRLPRASGMSSIASYITLDSIHGRLILATDGASAIVQKTFNIAALLEQGGGDYLLPISRPARSLRFGTAFSYQIHSLSKHGRVIHRIERGPSGMQVTADGLVTWMPSMRGAVSAIIGLSDGSGGSCFHIISLLVY